MFKGLWKKCILVYKEAIQIYDGQVIVEGYCFVN